MGVLKRTAAISLNKDKIDANKVVDTIIERDHNVWDATTFETLLGNLNQLKNFDEIYARLFLKDYLNSLQIVNKVCQELYNIDDVKILPAYKDITNVYIKKMLPNVLKAARQVVSKTDDINTNIDPKQVVDILLKDSLIKDLEFSDLARIFEINSQSKGYKIISFIG